jgi:lipopolysaccharide export LptBFGC system permease protein LptF
MLTALLVYFVYSNILGVTVALIRREAIPPHISLWVVNLAFFLLAIYMFRRRSRNQRLIPGFSG